jgi:hypothetical protein
MRRKEVVLAFIYAAIALFQVAWHWLLSLDTVLSRALETAYLYRSPHSGKGIAGYLDLVLPGVIAGICTGCVGLKWGFKRLSLFALVAAVGIVGLDPLYRPFLDARRVYWWPHTPQDQVSSTVIQVFKALVVVGFFTYAGRLVTLDLRERKGNPE